MQRLMIFSIVAITAYSGARAYGQGFRGLEGGTPEANAQGRRSQQERALMEQAEALQEEAKPFAGVTDVDSFVKAARVSQRRKVKALYDRREHTQAEKGVRASQRRDRIAAINRQIVDLNNPTRAYLPQLMTGNVLTLLDPGRPSVHVLYVVDDTNVIVKLGSREVWLMGIPTKGWADDEGAKVDGILMQHGTKSYETTEGAMRTLPLFVPLDLRPNDERLMRRGDVRTWTTKQGKTHRGALVLYDRGDVTIVDMDGTKAVVKLVDLGPDDWDYVVSNAPAPKRRR